MFEAPRPLTGHLAVKAALTPLDDDTVNPLSGSLNAGMLRSVKPCKSFLISRAHTEHYVVQIQAYEAIEAPNRIRSASPEAPSKALNKGPYGT